MVRYLTNSEDPQNQPIWVDASHPLPDVCCTCGMFTADRIKIKHLALVKKSGKASAVWGNFRVLLLLFGGPIGWLFALGSFGGEADDDGNSVKKIKIKIPQCILCRSETRVELTDSKPEHSLYQFYAHPIFIERYQSQLSENEQ